MLDGINFRSTGAGPCLSVNYATVFLVRSKMTLEGQGSACGDDPIDCSALISVRNGRLVVGSEYGGGERNSVLLTRAPGAASGVGVGIAVGEYGKAILQRAAIRGLRTGIYVEDSLELLGGSQLVDNTQALYVHSWRDPLDPNDIDSQITIDGAKLSGNTVGVIADPDFGGTLNIKNSKIECGTGGKSIGVVVHEGAEGEIAIRDNTEISYCYIGVDAAGPAKINAVQFTSNRAAVKLSGAGDANEISRSSFRGSACYDLIAPGLVSNFFGNAPDGTIDNKFACRPDTALPPKICRRESKALPDCRSDSFEWKSLPNSAGNS
jgi:hypothetical protein